MGSKFTIINLKVFIFFTVDCYEIFFKNNKKKERSIDIERSLNGLIKTVFFRINTYCFL